MKPLASLQELKGSKTKIFFLLGMPYVNTFIHDTTPLKKHELKTADRLILPFSSTPEDYRAISTISIGHKKNLTIHSHLTGKGKKKVKDLKKVFCFSTWLPLVEFLAEKYTQTATHKSSQLFFSKEVLQLKYSKRQLKLLHIPYWNTAVESYSFKNFIPLILPEGDAQEGVDEVIQFKQGTVSVENSAFLFLKDLLFSQEKSAKGFKKALKKKIHPFTKIKSAFSPLYLLSATLSLLLACTLTLIILIHQERATRQSLKKEKSLLSKKLDMISQKFKTKRKLIEIDAYHASVKKLNFSPLVVLKTIEQSLPPAVWVSKVDLSLHSNQVELIAPKDLKIDRALKKLKEKFPSITLNTSKTLEVAGQKTNLYTINLGGLL